MIGTILSYMFVGVLLVFMLVILIITLYYTTYDFWWRLRWKYRKRKVENLVAFSMPISSKVTEGLLERTTDEVDRRVRTRIPNKMHRIKTITMSTDEAGSCYITVWYVEKRHRYVENSYHETYNNPLANWQL